MNSIVKHLYENVNLESDYIEEEVEQELEDIELEEINSTSSGGDYSYGTPFAFSKTGKTKKRDAKPFMPLESYANKFESIFKKIEDTVDTISENRYSDFKQDDTVSNKVKINTGIREISNMLNEMERNLTMLTRLKTEIGADQTIFFKNTFKKFGQISERINKISNKVRELSK